MTELKIDGYSSLVDDSRYGEFVLCKICGKKSDYILSGDLCICDQCHNITAVHCDEVFFQPKDIILTEWNALSENDDIINEDLLLKSCSTIRDWLVLKLLQALARNEERGFRPFRLDEHKGELIYHLPTGKCVGYILWSKADNGFAMLCQIYIIFENRRNKFATLAIKHWVENIANKLNGQFYVDSPNSKSVQILAKLGYLNEGEKCIIVRF